MLDGTLLSAPRVMSTITDSGQITGQFTSEEVDFLVDILQAGSLKAALKKVPIAENTIGAIVGDEMIRRGKLAAGLAMASTFLFMVLWYRFAGVVACFALAVNLLLTLAVMKFPLRRPADPARLGRSGSERRHGGRCERAGLRAHPRGTGTRSRFADGNPQRV